MQLVERTTFSVDVQPSTATAVALAMQDLKLALLSLQSRRWSILYQLQSDWDQKSVIARAFTLYADLLSPRGVDWLTPSGTREKSEHFPH